MHRALLALALTAMLATGCTSTADLLDAPSIKGTRFKDNDPQDFGRNHPGTHAVHGIDLSKWNGTDIDWQEVKKSGVAFVFIKGTEGKDRIDSAFTTHWRGAASAGIPHSAYHFYYFCSTPEDQADWFIQNVPKEANMLPPVLDMEWNHASPTCKLKPDTETVRDVMQRFMDRIEAHYGVKPIIYTSVDFHRDRLVGAFSNHHFWVRSVAAHPSQIYANRKWTFWQYTATGIIPGIKGPTDINVFSGSEKSWRQWVASANR